MRHRTLLAACLGAFLLVGQARAQEDGEIQDPAPVPDETELEDEEVDAVAEGDPMEESYTGPAPALPAESPQTRAGLGPLGPVQLALGAGVPVWLGAPALDPGFALGLRVGYDFGLVAPELTFGFGHNSVNRDAASVLPAGSTLAARDLERATLGLGLRGQWTNASRVQPFLSGGVDFNFWSFTRYVCTEPSYLCGANHDYDLIAGLSGRLGVLIRLYQALHLELGGRVAVTFPGQLFGDAQAWLEPYLAVALE